MVFHNFLASWDGQGIFHRDSWLRRYSFLAHFLGVSGEACRQTTGGQHGANMTNHFPSPVFWQRNQFSRVVREVHVKSMIHSGRIHGFPIWNSIHLQEAVYLSFKIHGFHPWFSSKVFNHSMVQWLEQVCGGAGGWIMSYCIGREILLHVRTLG